MDYNNKMISSLSKGDLFFAGNFIFEFQYFTHETMTAAATYAEDVPEKNAWEYFVGDRLVTIAKRGVDIK